MFRILFAYSLLILTTAIAFSKSEKHVNFKKYKYHYSFQMESDSSRFYLNYDSIYTLPENREIRFLVQSSSSKDSLIGANIEIISDSNKINEITDIDGFCKVKVPFNIKQIKISYPFATTLLIDNPKFYENVSTTLFVFMGSGKGLDAEGLKCKKHLSNKEFENYKIDFNNKIESELIKCKVCISYVIL